MSSIAAIEIDGILVPRLAFGLGSLMKWAPNHAYPLPTDSSKEIRQAIAAGFRHFNTGDLYTNNPSAAEALRSSGLKRSEFFFSLKLNTYAMLGCKGAQHMIESVDREIKRFRLKGYVDLVQLHFPPRAYPGNLTNREAWRVLEGLKDQGIARLIGVSNWSLNDYADIIESADLKYKPRVNEYEFNPFLLFDPRYRELHQYEVTHGIINMNYGVLTVVSNVLTEEKPAHLTAELRSRSAETGLSDAELLLSWAYYRLKGIVVTSTSKEERAVRLINLFSAGQPDTLEAAFDGIEQAAKADGYAGKVFYTHPHMDAARDAE